MNPTGVAFDADGQLNPASLPDLAHYASVFQQAETAFAGQPEDLARFKVEFFAQAHEFGRAVGADIAQVEATMLAAIDGFSKSIANAGSELTAEGKVGGALFEWGQALATDVLRAFRDALDTLLTAASGTAHAMPPSIREALATSLSNIELAAQRVVVRSDTGANPFDDPTFDPNVSPVSIGGLEEGSFSTFTVYLPYEAGIGGQRIRLDLGGVAVEKLSVLGNGEEVELDTDGVFTLTVAQGQREISFSVAALADLDADETLTLSAQLVNATDQATHQPHDELTLTLDAENETAPAGGMEYHGDWGLKYYPAFNEDGSPMLDDNGAYLGIRGVGSDVTEQRESSEKIAYLARYDTLTALPNRLMLHEAVTDALRYADKWRTRCAFLMIDLDRFKAVNDSLGHLVGDKLLAQVAQRLQALMGEGESCGRLGGDEFAVVLRDASDKTRIDALARSIIERLSEPYRVDEQLLYVGASIGSSLGPRDGRTVEELMRNADLALYRSKDLGGGEHCEYEPSLHASAEERRQLEFALRSALKRDELLLHYQPVVDSNTEELVSFEALVRWNSAEHGFISPAKFIPLAEDTRLIVPIGQWVMRTAMDEAARWPSPVKVNINVSPEQLIEPDFAASVVRALSGSGLAAERVEIEVTESIFLKDANVARKALEAVMALGCSVALDDFGTGYSSLGYLRTLKFSTIKVDRSFVTGAGQGNAESLAIIRAVVAMADSLGMTTTAEGVENGDEADLIRTLGCTKIQGYHFGRPMPAAEARQLLHRAELRKSA